jgi:hypothetical protein
MKKLLLSLRFFIRSFIANSQLNLTIFTELHSFNTALAAHSIDQLYTIFVPLPFLHFHPQPFANLRRFGLKNCNSDFDSLSSSIDACSHSISFSPTSFFSNRQNHFFVFMCQVQITFTSIFVLSGSCRAPSPALFHWACPVGLCGALGLRAGGWDPLWVLRLGTASLLV